jgi:beta-glucosidase
MRVDQVDDEVVVEVTAVNNGTRQGTEVVQVYLRAPESLVRRPDRELVGFAKVVVDAGGRATVRVPLGADAFRYWDDVETHAWRSDPGRYELLVGTSSHEIWGSTEVIWGGTPAS